MQVFSAIAYINRLGIPCIATIEHGQKDAEGTHLIFKMGKDETNHGCETSPDKACEVIAFAA